MTQTAPQSAIAKKMVARDPHEAHRASTPLELFFDLCFVVAIAQAGTCLHHGIAHAHFGQAIGSYLLLFFAIWWAWMNFTWFASAYDCDDPAYRIKTFIQMAGALVIAAGVPRAFEQGQWRIIIAGYAIARIGLIANWLRAASSDPARRKTALRMAGALAVVQVLWIGAGFMPAANWFYLWFALALLELAVPIWAERAGATPWHPHHMAERYGLLTLIVLGESVLGATLAMQAALDDAHPTAELYSVIGGGILVLFAMWWLYFDRESHGPSETGALAFLWGYGHFVIFVAAAAVGAGLAVAADYSVHKAHISTGQAGLAVAAPVAVYVLMTWLVRIRPLRLGRGVDGACWAAIGLVLLAAISTWSVLIIGLTMCCLCVVLACTSR
jgi:low temperature requirement protein LtrA